MSVVRQVGVDGKSLELAGALSTMGWVGALAVLERNEVSLRVMPLVVS